MGQYTVASADRVCRRLLEYHTFVILPLAFYYLPHVITPYWLYNTALLGMLLVSVILLQIIRSLAILLE